MEAVWYMTSSDMWQKDSPPTDATTHETCSGAEVVEEAGESAPGAKQEAHEAVS